MPAPAGAGAAGIRAIPYGARREAGPSYGGPFGSAQDKPFDSAQGRPFDSAQDKPFDCAQGRPFDCAQDRQALRLRDATLSDRVGI